MVIVITQLSNFYQQKPLVAASGECAVCGDGSVYVEMGVCMWRWECVQNVFV